MSRERTLNKVRQDLKYRQPHRDLEASIDDCMTFTNRYGLPSYRHRSVAKKHLTMDPTQTEIKRRLNKVARLVIKKKLLDVSLRDGL